MTTPSDPPGYTPQRLPPNTGAREPAAADGWMEAGTEWRRQHPAACFLNALQIIRRMVFPIIAGVLTVRGPFLTAFLSLLVLISIALALLRYWRYRYRFTEHELVVEEGWLYRKVRNISYSRIQNINITRNVIHRIFGVSGMQLESASGNEPEAVMEALSETALEELNDRVDRTNSEESIPAEAIEQQNEEEIPRTFHRDQRRQILRLGLGELVRHGLVSNRGIVLVAAAVGYLFQGPLGDRFFPVLVGWFARYTERPPTEVLAAMGPYTWFLLGVAVFLIALLALTLLSVVYSIVRYYGYTLSVDSRIVRAEYGLLTRVAITIPKGRIQLINFRANPFHRLFGRLSVRVETAGVSGGEENASSLRWLAPILPEADVGRVLREVQPELCGETFEWHPLHQRTRARLLRIRLIQLIVVAVLLAFFTGIVGFFALLLVPLALAYAAGYFRYAGWAVTPRVVAFRDGWIVKQQSFVRYPKIQVLSLNRNPFDRRWGMATISVDTAGADPRGHRIQIRFMDHESARELRNFLEEKTHETEFVWG